MDAYVRRFLREWWTDAELDAGMADPAKFLQDEVKPRLAIERRRKPHLPRVYMGQGVDGLPTLKIR